MYESEGLRQALKAVNANPSRGPAAVGLYLQAHSHWGTHGTWAEGLPLDYKAGVTWHRACRCDRATRACPSACEVEAEITDRVLQCVASGTCALVFRDGSGTCWVVEVGVRETFPVSSLPLMKGWVSFMLVLTLFPFTPATALGYGNHRPKEGLWCAGGFPLGRAAAFSYHNSIKRLGSLLKCWA